MDSINILSLAFLGDAVFEKHIRKYLILNYDLLVNDLQSLLISYVSAESQASIMEKILAADFLDDNELEIYKRGRNAKVKSKPKNAKIITYKIATGFEALIGYLELQDKDRLNDLFNFILEEQ